MTSFYHPPPLSAMSDGTPIAKASELARSLHASIDAGSGSFAQSPVAPLTLSRDDTVRTPPPCNFSRFQCLRSLTQNG
jgi:hypothetical protein